MGAYAHHPYFVEHSLGAAVSSLPAPEVNGRASTISFRSPIYSVWEQLEYPFRLGRCRIWHAPHYNVPFLKGKTRLVVTVHDLIHWIFRKDYYSRLQGTYARLGFQKVVRSADRIIAVSRQTRDDLIQHFGASPEKIRVIYEGVSPEFEAYPTEEERQRVLKKFGLPARFFLYVGMMKPHKNVNRLIELFEKLRNQKKLGSALVLVGRKDRKYPKGFERLEKLETGNGIHYLSGVESKKELAALYASAVALVHPSFYEGFGLTCLEAMALGTPVIVSQVASLPEVVGEAGYYVNPYSEESIGKALLEVEGNDSLRKELSQAGLRRAREFSWAKAAEETIQVYQELLECA